LRVKENDRLTYLSRKSIPLCCDPSILPYSSWLVHDKEQFVISPLTITSVAEDATRFTGRTESIILKDFLDLMKRFGRESVI
jgi:hypothetical protein